jgi:thiamine biosynthesis lipoprotein
MSFHDRHSDLGRLNRLAFRVPVRVHPWTWQVLQAALYLSRATRGAFDVTIGGELVRLGYLPPPMRTLQWSHACWKDLLLLPGHRVRFSRPLYIDLGGIAKGFAVDQAVARLRANGITAGLVNAGGDLRVFGEVERNIHVRHPGAPGILIPAARLVSGALATSASYFSQRQWRGRNVTPVIDKTRPQSRVASFSVSVFAARCMLADALTKVVLVRGARASGSVRRLGGLTFLLAADAPAAQLARVA